MKASALLYHAHTIATTLRSTVFRQRAVEARLQPIPVKPYEVLPEKGKGKAGFKPHIELPYSTPGMRFVPPDLTQHHHQPDSVIGSAVRTPWNLVKAVAGWYGIPFKKVAGLLVPAEGNVHDESRASEAWWKLWEVNADCKEIGGMECYDGYHLALIEQ